MFEFFGSKFRQVSGRSKMATFPPFLAYSAQFCAQNFGHHIISPPFRSNPLPPSFGQTSIRRVESTPPPLIPSPSRSKESPPTSSTDLFRPPPCLSILCMWCLHRSHPHPATRLRGLCVSRVSCHRHRATATVAARPRPKGQISTASRSHPVRHIRYHCSGIECLQISWLNSTTWSLLLIIFLLIIAQSWCSADFSAHTVCVNLRSIFWFSCRLLLA